MDRSQSATMSKTTSTFTRHFWYTVAVLAAMVAVFGGYVVAEKAIDTANAQRLRSLQLADEMRRSSDDLTRLAVLSVMTGDDLYQRHYEALLDIREGRKPRPPRDRVTSFDMAAAVDPPVPEGVGMALVDRMRSAGFIDQELALLAQAKALSDSLTRTEREAMQLSRVQGSDAEASHARARAMLHDAAYLSAKAAIMAPIEGFHTQVMERTQAAVAQAERNALALRVVFMGLGLLLMFMLYRTSRALRTVMGGTVDAVHAQITRLGQGDFSAPLALAKSEPGSVMARLAESQAKLKQMADERAHTQLELQRSTTRLKEAERLALMGHWELDLVTNALIWSDETYAIFELDPARPPLYETFLGVIHPDDRERVNKAYTESVLRKESRYRVTHRLQMPDGRVKHVHERGETHFSATGEPLRTMGTVQDVTSSLQGKLALERANRDLRLLSDCNTALVHAEEESGLLTEICRLCVERGGYRMAWVGYAMHDAVHSVRVVAQSGDQDGYLQNLPVTWADEPHGRGPVGTAIRTGLPCAIDHIKSDPRMAMWREQTGRRSMRSCVALPLVCSASVIGALALYSEEEDRFDPDELRLLMELATDLAYGISTLRTRAEHAQAKVQLEFLSNFDPLTHLPNRLLLRDRFEHAARVAQADGRRVSMLYIDLDHFKQVNDSLGYAVGDQVIVKVVERLQHCIPVASTVSRMSGDEFVVLLAGDLDAAAVAGVGNAIRDALVDPIKTGDSLLNISCSVGIGLYPGDGADFETLLKHAHTAVVSAKEAGRNTCRFFSHDLNDGMLEQVRLTGGLASALRKREFVLHYQPQLDLASGRIVGVEALVRWQHPVDGLLPPGRFIALAERSGHIVPLGEWVLHEACRQARQWQSGFLTTPVVGVNLSALQFKRGNVLEMVASALTASGLPPACLELELTESILLQDVESTIRTLQGLKAMGVKLSIDDFGTGYSSLSYLKRLAVDKLKIDQSFVRDMLTGSDGASIVQAIIQLGHNLQLTVIAEGVETMAERDFLERSGCDEAQGYLFSRPVPVDQIERLLRTGIGRPGGPIEPVHDL